MQRTRRVLYDSMSRSLSMARMDAEAVYRILLEQARASRRTVLVLESAEYEVTVEYNSVWALANLDALHNTYEFVSFDAWDVVVPNSEQSLANPRAFVPSRIRIHAERRTLGVSRTEVSMTSSNGFSATLVLDNGEGWLTASVFDHPLLLRHITVLDDPLNQIHH